MVQGKRFDGKAVDSAWTLDGWQRWSSKVVGAKKTFLYVLRALANGAPNGVVTLCISSLLTLRLRFSTTSSRKVIMTIFIRPFA